MHLLLDLSHPAYAHTFHPFILEMQSRGHSFLIFARDKEITQELLKAWGIPFISKGKGKGPLVLKLFDTIRVVWKMYREGKKFNPDVVLSYSSYHAAIAGWFLRKPVLTFEDTENVSLLHKINSRFSTRMITPSCYQGDFGEKHVRFNGYKELSSLHPSRFTANTSFQPEKPYIILRFVSWKAWHDRGHQGISLAMKNKIIQELEKHATIYISSESPLPPEWRKYEVTLPPENFHSFLAGASLFFGESASIASEAAVLGIPSIYIDNTGRGYTHELEHKYNLLFRFSESDNEVQHALSKALSLLSDPNTPETWQKRRTHMLGEKVDVCEWMVDYVEDFGNTTSM